MHLSSLIRCFLCVCVRNGGSRFQLVWAGWILVRLVRLVRQVGLDWYICTVWIIFRNKAISVSWWRTFQSVLIESSLYCYTHSCYSHSCYSHISYIRLCCLGRASSLIVHTQHPYQQVSWWTHYIRLIVIINLCAYVYECACANANHMYYARVIGQLAA